MEPRQAIRIISWNVNGLRAVFKKGFLDSLHQLKADIVCLQETKIQEPQLTHDMQQIPGYRSYWSFSTLKKGYSGVAVYTAIEPVQVQSGIGVSRFDQEGRILEVDYGAFLFYNIYFPNGQMSEERLQYKLDFYEEFFSYLQKHRDKGRSIIITGDFNTAHNEMDLKNPKANQKTSGFLRIERDWIDRIIDEGYVDTFRHFHPDTIKYSWWTYRFNARTRNAGWRIDYFFVTRDLIEQGVITEAFIDNEIYGSDHCPVGIEITWPQARDH
jgi:exodeoxyribonuclease-3